VKRFGAVLVLLSLIVLPLFAQDGRTRGDLIRADYGSGNQWVEVTQRVRSLIRGESLNFLVDNDTLGVDPRPGEAKALRLQFRDENGRNRQLTFQENQYVDLRVNGARNQNQENATTWGGSNTPRNGACFYRSGFDSEGFCVKTGQSLSAMPSGFNDQISSIQLFGDAMVTVFKDSGFSGDHQTFSSSISDLRYSAAGNWTDRISSLRVDRSGSSMSGDANSYGGDLRITRAVYGAGNRLSDVTNRLNSQIRGNQLSLQVTNDTMGGDPSPNQIKTLTVQYTYNGSFAQSIVSEGNYLSLPMGGSYGRDSSYNDGSLQITRARYGAGNRMADVTARLNSQIRGGQLSIRVTNDTMGGDPSPNLSKTLMVQYVYNGGQGQVEVNEGGTLNLPTDYASSASQTIRCESNNNARNYCPVDTRGGVRLSRQISGSACAQGSTWGYDNNRIWVDNGCRADFEVLPVNYGSVSSSSQIIRCESNNNARNYCPVDTRGGVRLSRQISGSACTQGSTWGYDNRGVWVDNGCRAHFQVSSPFAAGASSTPYGTYATIPNGTQLAIRTNEVIDSATSAAGQKFSAVMYADVPDSSGAVAIPKGSDVELVIRSTAGSDLVLDIDSLVVAGQRYVVSTSDLEQKGGQGIGANRRTAEMVGGGAAAGAIIGAILGGGKGAAIGAGVGAAGGAGVVVLTKGKEVKVPAETILNFRLDTDLRLQPASW
jgi:Protein of unknown function (DUF3011)